MPTPDDTEVMGPTEAHNGRGAVWQMLVKSPKPDIVGFGMPVGLRSKFYIGVFEILCKYEVRRWCRKARIVESNGANAMS